MSKPKGLSTRIFLDSGDPTETKAIIDTLGFLDGQTTNPTLVSKNSEVKQRLDAGDRFTQDEIFSFYQNVVKQISAILPNGSVSIEVYADHATKAEDMIEQAQEMYTWIPNAHIKLPTTHEGLKAAEQLVRGEMRLNMTLCFSQAQAAAVYAATQGAKKGQIFVSPFIGRLDDRGENGMDLIRNIIQMYKAGDGHVEVLTASIRKVDHLFAAFQLCSDIVTVPFAVLQEWGDTRMEIPRTDFVYQPRELKPIPYQEIDLGQPWTSYDISHNLTQKGIEKFSEDWNGLIQFKV